MVGENPHLHYSCIIADRGFRGKCRLVAEMGGFKKTFIPLAFVVYL